MSRGAPAEAAPAPGVVFSEHVAETVDAVAAFHREHYERASQIQRVIDAATEGLGRPAAVIVLGVIVALWASLAAWQGGGQVDEPSFAWLELAATVAALVASLLILVTQRREDLLADRRAQLTLELAVLADRKSAKIIALLEELRRDQPGVIDREDAESEAMAKPADPSAVAASIDAKARGRVKR